MNYIIMIHDDKIYKIDKEPFETDENTYIRGWFIINKNTEITDELISRSIIHLNEYKNNMKYV